MRIFYSVIILIISVQSNAEIGNRKPASASNFQVSKIVGSKCSTAERWIDTVNNMVCYSASPGGSSAFRMNCLSFLRLPSQAVQAFANPIKGSAYSLAESWTDPDIRVVCSVASPGGSSSFDLSCKEMF